MADLFSIDGRVFNLKILRYEIGTEILDGAASDRTQADGWPMFRQPQGTIININSIEFGGLNSSKQDFMALVQVLRSFGTRDFRRVKLVTQVDDIEQLMYAPSFTQSINNFNHNGVTYWGSLKTKFIAEKGVFY